MTQPREGPSVAEKAAASSCLLPNAQLLDRIRREYLEMPGLKLTLAQAQRLWQLGEECLELLGMLVDAKFLCRRSDGRYARVSELDVSTKRPSTMKAGIDPRAPRPELSWEDVHEPGAYVEMGTGDLYRIPKEALIPSGSPVIRKESSGASRLAQLSKNPFITTRQARVLACEHDIEPNF
jgi:hypothetical protein